MKQTLQTLGLALGVALTACSQPRQQADEAPGLTFDATRGVAQSLTMPDGSEVHYTAYEGMYYVAHVEDSAYQTLNVYVPEGATQQTPILLRTYVGGYMAAAARRPSATDATGRALREGYVVAIPGSRGRSSTVIATASDASAGISEGQPIYTGRAPAALLDLKAAIRYLRQFDGEMAGDAECIITDGTSAGGAMSALMGATGNNPAYEPLLRQMGAAAQRDDVFAAVCYCPITDLDHADMAYEWLYNGTDARQQGDPRILAFSDELKALFPAYVESLHLTTPDGTALTADNYADFIKRELIRAAQLAKNAGADIPDTIGFTFSDDDMAAMPPLNGGMGQSGGPQGAPQGNMMLQGDRMPRGAARPGGQMPLPMRRGGRGGGRTGEYITGLDLTKYLNYVAGTQPLKTAPAFDTQGVGGQAASGENEEFGDRTGASVNFTDYSAAKAGTVVSDEVRANVRLMNPMPFIGDDETRVAPFWYIRHGARDRDTAFPIALNLALRLRDTGHDVNYLLAWNRPHSGDYALDELFQWIADITTPRFGDE